MYADADLERIRLLRDGVANGHPIGRIAQLDEAALRGLAAAATRPADKAADPPEWPAAARGIVDALTTLDFGALGNAARPGGDALASTGPAQRRDHAGAPRGGRRVACRAA